MSLAILFSSFTSRLPASQYIPYIFQILAQMLEFYKHDAPADYRSVLPFLQPAVWQQNGSVPGLVKLLKAFLARDAKQIVAGAGVGGTGDTPTETNPVKDQRWVGNGAPTVGGAGYLSVSSALFVLSL